MKKSLVLTVAACLQLSVAGLAQGTGSRSDSSHAPPAFAGIQGKVVDESGKPLHGARVTVKNTAQGTVTDPKGRFSVSANEGQTLVIASQGYEEREVLVGADKTPTIQLELNLASLLNTTVVNKGYYTTTQRLNTGNVSTIKATEIASQPVPNPLATLEGRAPGVITTQANGLPGASFSVQIRGKSSILNGDGPLYLIDGVPFTNTSLSLGVISANGFQSPFNNINPADIESIEILKDADATAIYGSRGANGVVLITTRKGRSGKTKLDLNVYTGTGRTTRMIDLMNTQQYIRMRREALANDGLTPDIFGAPDLAAWDTTRYTDWKKLLTGGSAAITDAQATLSGGNVQTQFLLSGALHRETTVFRAPLSDVRGAFHFNLTHISQDNRFKVTFTTNYSIDNIALIGQDLTGAIRSSPNAPTLYDSTGKLNWSEGGASFSNPLAYLLQKSTANTDNMISNLVLRYQLLPGLDLKSNLGYNSIQLQQTFIYPGASLDPAFNFTGFAEYSNNNFKSWIIEPQAEYQNAWGKAKLEVLVGTSFQQEKTNGSITFASNFSSDALLLSPSAAGTTSVNNNNTLYHYQAVFGRINLNWADRYLLNLTGRRDGSSRFGPDRQFASFGAIGAAWIFSRTAFIKEQLPFLKYGKIRGSLGITGNDQIGDYQFLNTYSSFLYPYQGQTALVPTQLYNPDYSWETNRKSELGLELGFWDNRLSAMISYYRNRSTNQLINYSLPIQTGFNSVIQNFPSLVQNTGWEYQLNGVIVKGRSFNWEAGLNLTVARNALLEFPNLASSAYAQKYEIGKPLNILKLVHVAEIDPQTGIFQFTDKNGHITATPTFPDDYTVVKDLTPAFYGGVSNRFQYKGISLSVFFQFVRQDGLNIVYNNSTPGTMNNQPTAMLNHWRQPGDQAATQLYTTTGSAATAYYYYSSGSDGAVSDASYIRLKNAALSYSVPSAWSRRIKAESVRFYLQGQNLVTFTSYKGGDPEIRNAAILPPLRRLTAGVQLSF